MYLDNQCILIIGWIHNAYFGVVLSHNIDTCITISKCQMPVDTESVFIHSIYIMILSYIDTVTIMIGIITPYKIMPPQILIVGKVISEESVSAKNC